jgi:predicted acylesterase/phospholipase RssA
MTGVGRRGFLGALAAAAGTPAIAASQTVAAVPAAPDRLGQHALVLAGGANRGAYQAGVIGGLVAREGLRDGQPLPFDAVCGTSIGALNGYFVATAQYSRLRELWREVSTKNIFAVKPRYEKITWPSAGVGTRAYESISLGLGLTKNVRGVIDRERIIAYLADVIQPADPVEIPLYIATTNLTQRRGQVFLRAATSTRGRALQALNDELIREYMTNAVRVATDALIRPVLLASASIPIALDPQEIPRPGARHDEVQDEYVDGGVTDNVPLEIARRCAQNIHAILVDPQEGTPNEHDASALEIALGVFETMQRRIFEYEVLLAIAETGIVPTSLTDAAGLTSLPATFFLIQPDAPLPGSLGDFNDLASLDAMWTRGYNDGIKGWPAFDVTTLKMRRTIF